MNVENKPQSSENYFECQSRGHKAFECPTWIRRLEKELGKKEMHATISDNEENPDTQQDSHDFVVFAAQVSLEETNQKIFKNSLFDDEKDFLGLQSAYDTLLL